MTTSFHSWDVSKTFDFSTEHNFLPRFCAISNATRAIRSICRDNWRFFVFNVGPLYYNRNCWSKADVWGSLKEYSVLPWQVRHLRIFGCQAIVAWDGLTGICFIAVVKQCNMILHNWKSSVTLQYAIVYSSISQRISHVLSEVLGSVFLRTLSGRLVGFCQTRYLPIHKDTTIVHPDSPK